MLFRKKNIFNNYTLIESNKRFLKLKNNKISECIYIYIYISLFVLKLSLIINSLMESLAKIIKIYFSYYIIQLLVLYIFRFIRYEL